MIEIPDIFRRIIERIFISRILDQIIPLGTGDRGKFSRAIVVSHMTILNLGVQENLSRRSLTIFSTNYIITYLHDDIRTISGKEFRGRKFTHAGRVNPFGWK